MPNLVIRNFQPQLIMLATTGDGGGPSVLAFFLRTTHANLLTYSLLGATQRLNSVESKCPSPLVSNSESNISFCLANSGVESNH